MSYECYALVLFPYQTQKIYSSNQHRLVEKINYEGMPSEETYLFNQRNTRKIRQIKPSLVVRVDHISKVDTQQCHPKPGQQGEIINRGVVMRLKEYQPKQPSRMKSLGKFLKYTPTLIKRTPTGRAKRHFFRKGYTRIIERPIRCNIPKRTKF